MSSKWFSCGRAEPDDREELTNHVTCKVVVVGDGMVGKTSLLTRYVTNQFDERYEQTIFDNQAAPVTVGKKKVVLHLFDTAGQEGYEHLRHFMYPHTDVVLMCFAVDSPPSLANILEKWLPEVRLHLAKTPILLLGLKTDLRSPPPEVTSLRTPPEVTSLRSPPEVTSLRTPPEVTSLRTPAEVTSLRTPPEVTSLRTPPEEMTSLRSPAEVTSRRTPSDALNGNDVWPWEQRLVGYAEGQAVGREIGARAYFECSAKRNVGLTPIFQEAARLHLAKRRSSSLSSIKTLFSPRASYV